MQVKKYNPFVVKSKTDAKDKPKSKIKTKPKTEPKTKHEAKGWGTKGEAPLSLENKKKLDIIYANGFVKTSSLIKSLSMT